jgi:hypothetical protein
VQRRRAQKKSDTWRDLKKKKKKKKKKNVFCFGKYAYCGSLQTPRATFFFPPARLMFDWNGSAVANLTRMSSILSPRGPAGDAQCAPIPTTPPGQASRDGGATATTAIPTTPTPAPRGRSRIHKRIRSRHRPGQKLHLPWGRMLPAHRVRDVRRLRRTAARGAATHA